MGRGYDRVGGELSKVLRRLQQKVHIEYDGVLASDVESVK